VGADECAHNKKQPVIVTGRVGVRLIEEALVRLEELLALTLGIFLGKCVNILNNLIDLIRTKSVSPGWHIL